SAETRLYIFDHELPVYQLQLTVNVVKDRRRTARRKNGIVGQAPNGKNTGIFRFQYIFYLAQSSDQFPLDQPEIPILDVLLNKIADAARNDSPGNIRPNFFKGKIGSNGVCFQQGVIL